METVVYQSYRTFDVPAWIGRCMQSVQGWAASQGFDYRFIDDRLFTYAPSWYRQKVADHVNLVADLARLVVAKELLSEGYGRTVWVDADVVVFGPEQFNIDVTEDYAFCRELWVEPDGTGGLTGSTRVNNAVTVFVQPNDFLDFYIHACKSIVRHGERLDGLAVSTRFLTALHQVMPFRLIDQVGLFSPIVLGHMAHALESTLQDYRRWFGSPFYAANLCSSFRNTSSQSVPMSDDLYGIVVDQLLNARSVVATSQWRG